MQKWLLLDKITVYVDKNSIIHSVGFSSPWITSTTGYVWILHGIFHGSIKIGFRFFGFNLDRFQIFQVQLRQVFRFFGVILDRFWDFSGFNLNCFYYVFVFWTCKTWTEGRQPYHVLYHSCIVFGCGFCFVFVFFVHTFRETWNNVSIYLLTVIFKHLVQFSGCLFIFVMLFFIFFLRGGGPALFYQVPVFKKTTLFWFYILELTGIWV